MKIKITYENEENIKPVLDALNSVLPGAKIHKSDRYKPFLHAYMTTKKVNATTK